MTATRWLGLVLLGAALVAGGLAFVRKETSELPVYVLGAERVLRGEAIYRADDAKPFTYPPFFALPFVPLAHLPATWQRPAWYVLNLGLLALVLHLARIWGQEVTTTPQRKAIYWLLLAALAGRHLSAVFENQSHDLLVAATVLLGAECWRRGRELPAAALFGIGAACKATPLLFVLPLVLRRRWPGSTVLVGVALGLTWLPDLLTPQQGGKLWCVAWFETFLSGLDAGGTASAQGAWNAHSLLNQSLSGTLFRLTHPAPEPGPFVRDVAVVAWTGAGGKVLVLAAQLGVLAVLALLARRARPFALAAACACGMVLLSPMSSKSHFCVLLLPAAYATACWLEGRSRALLLVLGAQAALGVLTIKGIVGSEFGNLCLAYGSVTGCALLALVATGVAAWPRLPAPGTAAA